MKNLIIVNTSDVAQFFDVSIRSVQHWAASGCPKQGRGKFDLKAVHAWWWLNIASARAEAEAGDESLQEQRRLYWQAKAERERLAVEREKGELIPKEEIKIEWVARVSEVANGLQGLAMRLPPLIAGKEAREVRDIVKKNVRQILERYSRTGRFCHPEAMPDKKRVTTPKTKENPS